MYSNPFSKKSELEDEERVSSSQTSLPSAILENDMPDDFIRWNAHSMSFEDETPFETVCTCVIIADVCAMTSALFKSNAAIKKIDKCR
jgi:hypothetical protein